MSRLTKRYRIYRWRLRNLVKQYRAWRWRRKVRLLYKARTTSPLTELLKQSKTCTDPVFKWTHDKPGGCMSEEQVTQMMEETNRNLKALEQKVFPQMECELLEIEYGSGQKETTSIVILPDLPPNLVVMVDTNGNIGVLNNAPKA